MVEVLLAPFVTGIGVFVVKVLCQGPAAKGSDVVGRQLRPWKKSSSFIGAWKDGTSKKLLLPCTPSPCSADIFLQVLGWLHKSPAMHAQRQVRSGLEDLILSEPLTVRVFQLGLLILDP